MATDPKTVAAAAAPGFKLFKCEECANSVQAALVAAGHHGERIELRAGKKYRYMVCLSYDGGQATITLNGRHLGIRVDDAVFDNLHPSGMAYNEWLKDFDSPIGVRVHRVDAF
jgi:hypothetical protein